MSEQFIKHGYHITTNPSFQNKQYGIPPELEKQLETLAVNSQKGASRKMVEHLHQLIEKYPTVPQLKNYLSVAFHAQGNYEKAVEVNNWALKEHPDYLFARVNMAHAYIGKEDVEKVPALLGHDFELKSLYPDRDLFHLAEVTGYLKIVVRYFASIGNLELAENRLSLLKEIAPDHHDTEQAEVFLWPVRLKNAGARLEEENKNRISPVVNKVVPGNSNHPSPQFNHPHIHNLYQHDVRMSHEMLREIIALPRHSLIEDLESVLQDAINRYGYFKTLQYTDETHSFALHAFFLLKEIRAEESLKSLLTFLEGDSDFLHYWCGDHITVTLWQCIYTLGLSDTTLLKQFLLKPGIDTYSKSCVSTALCQITLHHPEKREEVLAIYKETFQHFSNADVEDNIIDSDFLGLTICDALDCKMPELLPLIENLFVKGLVSIGISGNYNAVAKAFSEEDRIDHKRDIQTVFNLYDDVLTKWAGYKEDSYDEDFEDDFYFPQQPIISEKIGRNDPCPCGSGKKYKKCCLIKIIKE